MGLLDFIFPKRCVSCGKLGLYLCDNCFSYLSFDPKTICLVCGRPAMGGLTHPACISRYTIDGTFVSITYNRTAKRLLAKFKYKPYVTDLNNTLSDLFYEGLIQQESFYAIDKKDAVLCSIPLYAKKERVRGFNQAMVLANGLGNRLNLPVATLLKRIKNTKSQTGLKRDERKDNMKDAFVVAVGEEQKVPGSTILLVDDVMTSGATLAEAAKVLKKAGAKRVYGLVLAHGE